MFGFARAPQTTSLSRQARPRLEALEERWVPATITITSVTYGLGTSFTIAGTLSNNPTIANQAIKIDGAAQGSATTNARQPRI